MDFDSINADSVYGILSYNGMVLNHENLYTFDAPIADRNKFTISKFNLLKNIQQTGKIPNKITNYELGNTNQRQSDSGDTLSDMLSRIGVNVNNNQQTMNPTKNNGGYMGAPQAGYMGASLKKLKMNYL
jgi:hypothetical protein